MGSGHWCASRITSYASTPPCNPAKTPWRGFFVKIAGPDAPKRFWPPPRMEADSREKFVLRKSSAFSCYRTVFLGQAPSVAKPGERTNCDGRAPSQRYRRCPTLVEPFTLIWHEASGRRKD